MTSTASPSQPTPDPDLVKLAAFTVFQIKQGELLATMIQLGHRLGLFVALDGNPATIDQLAERTGYHRRWLQEWLYAVTAAKLLTLTDDEFVLSPEMAVVLARSGQPGFIGSIFGAPITPATVDRLAEAFTTGVGFSWDDHGESTCHMQAELSSGSQQHFLVPVVLAAIEGLHDKLAEGITMYDVGCGSGIAACTIAAAFPNSTVIGIDPSGHAISAAKERASSNGLTNASFIEGTFDDLPDGSVEFVLTLDVLHDLPYPVKAIERVKAALSADGVWLVADIKAGEHFTDNLKNPMLALFYSMSVAYCMNSALSEPGGAGLGTMGLHPERMMGWTEAAGFRSLVIHEFDHDISNRYFEVRP
ncbi:MAG: class I SAM-dependent methyltransferase [Acidimicrobiales bacterium]